MCGPAEAWVGAASAPGGRLGAAASRGESEGVSLGWRSLVLKGLDNVLEERKKKKGKL